MAKKVRNAFAVCNAQKSRASKKWSKAKLERCVRDVKRKSR